MQALHKCRRNGAVHFPAMAQAAAFVHIKADVVGIKRCLLAVVVAAHVIFQRALERARLNFLAVALFDGRTEAVGAGNKHHVLGADAIAQETRIAVGGNEHAAHMPEMQRLVAVGHARRNYRALGPFNAFFVILRRSHCSPTPSMPKPIRRRK